jgi:hypothetical protein
MAGINLYSLHILRPSFLYLPICQMYKAVLWIRDILVRIRIRRSVGTTDLRIRILPFPSAACEMPTKILLITSWGTLHQSSKIKSPNEVTK